jgi:hypothetical protein
LKESHLARFYYADCGRTFKILLKETRSAALSAARVTGKQGPPVAAMIARAVFSEHSFRRRKKDPGAISMATDQIDEGFLNYSPHTRVQELQLRKDKQPWEFWETGKTRNATSAW